MSQTASDLQTEYRDLIDKESSRVDKKIEEVASENSRSFFTEVNRLDGRIDDLKLENESGYVTSDALDNLKTDMTQYVDDHGSVIVSDDETMPETVPNGGLWFQVIES